MAADRAAVAVRVAAAVVDHTAVAAADHTAAADIGNR
jgi:hypothetical protein